MGVAVKHFRQQAIVVTYTACTQSVVCEILLCHLGLALSLPIKQATNHALSGLSQYIYHVCCDSGPGGWEWGGLMDRSTCCKGTNYS